MKILKKRTTRDSPSEAVFSFLPTTLLREKLGLKLENIFSTTSLDTFYQEFLLRLAYLDRISGHKYFFKMSITFNISCPMASLFLFCSLHFSEQFKNEKWTQMNQNPLLKSESTNPPYVLRFKNTDEGWSFALLE
jgi:hypothetical protein